jgi:hypothetical protein
MKKLIASFGLAAVITLAGCGGSNSSADGDVGQTYVTQLGHIADALESVKDEDSARAAAHEMAQANATLQAMAERVDSMTEVEQAMMLQKHAMEMTQVQTRIFQALQNIISRDPKLGDIIGDEMQQMPQFK